jgi:hypothetical protein
MTENNAITRLNLRENLADPAGYPINSIKRILVENFFNARFLAGQGIFSGPV